MAGSIDVAALRQRGAQLSARLTVMQKAMAVGAVAVLLIGGYFFMGWAGKPTYTTLFSNLAAEDASTITQKLASQGVQYQLVDGGQRVMVPESQVYQLRIDMSAAGLPSGGSQGYSLLDKQGLTTSEFRQRVDYQRAIEGEISKTLQAIDGVQAATVHLVIPKDDIFVSDNKKATASVLLKTRAGAALSTDQARTVVHLVSSSVEGLSPDDVTVADQTGKILSTAGADDTSSITEGNTRQTVQFENMLSQGITDLIAPYTGVGKAVIRVKADIDYSRRQTKSETFDQPNTSPVANELSNTEQFSGSNATASGVLGTTNTQGLTNAGTGDANSYTKTETQRTFQTGKVTEVVDGAPGAVRKMSVAVLVDSSTQNLDKPAIERLVSRAVGFDSARGDQVTVETLPFDTSAADNANGAITDANAAGSKKALFEMIRNGVIMIVLLGAAFMVWRTVKKALAESSARQMEIDLSSQDSMASLNAIQLALAGGQPGSAAGFDLRSLNELALGQPQYQGHQATPEVIERQQRANEVSALIDRQPAEVASLLRNWLADRRN